jgi:drug/metabolite transporter (DMT)-like permease
VILVRRRRFSSLAIKRADRPRLVIGALIGYSGYQLCSVFALDHSSVFTISLLIALVPLFTMLMMVAMGEPLPPLGWPGLALAVIGAVIFLADKRQSGDTILGAVLSLGAAISFAAYGLVNRPLVRAYASDLLAGWQLLIGTVPMLVIGSVSIAGQQWTELSARIWIGLVFVIIFPVYVAYQLWNYGISHRGAAVASSYGLIVPILSAVMAAILFEERITWLKALGAALALGGLLVIRAPAGWRPVLLRRNTAPW